MFKNVLVPKSRYFGTMVQLVQESPTQTLMLTRKLLYTLESMLSDSTQRSIN